MHACQRNRRSLGAHPCPESGVEILGRLTQHRLHGGKARFGMPRQPLRPDLRTPGLCAATRKSQWSLTHPDASEVDVETASQRGHNRIAPVGRMK